MFPTEFDRFTSIVSRVLRVEDVTYGDAKKQFVARYRGRLYSEDSAGAYEQLAAALRPLDVTPLFRKEKDQHVVILLPGIIRPRPSNIWVNVALFILTLLSVLIAGVYYTLGGEYAGPADPSLAQLLPYLIRSLGGGLAFTVSILAILLAH